MREDDFVRVREIDRKPEIIASMRGIGGKPIDIVVTPEPTEFQRLMHDIEANVKAFWEAANALPEISGEDEILVLGNAEKNGVRRILGELEGIQQHMIAQHISRKVFPDNDFRYTLLPFDEAYRLANSDTNEGRGFRASIPPGVRFFCREVIRTFSTPYTERGIEYIINNKPEWRARRVEMSFNNPNVDVDSDKPLALNPEGEILPDPAVSMKGLPDSIPTEEDIFSAYYRGYNALDHYKIRLGTSDAKLNYEGESRRVRLDDSIEGILRKAGLLDAPADVDSWFNRNVIKSGLFDDRGEAVIQGYHLISGDSFGYHVSPAMLHSYDMVEPNRTAVVLKKEAVR